MINIIEWIAGIYAIIGMFLWVLMLYAEHKSKIPIKITKLQALYVLIILLIAWPIIAIMAIKESFDESRYD